MIWLASLICLAIGGLLGVSLSWFFHPQLSPTVDVGNLLNVVATLGVAVAINLMFTNHIAARGSEASLLSEHVREVKEAVKALNQAAIACYSQVRLTPEEQRKLVAADRDVSNAVHSLETALECCGKRASTVDCTELKKARIQLKRAITDTPYPGPYTPAQASAIGTAFKQLKDQATKLSFKINKI